MEPVERGSGSTKLPKSAVSSIVHQNCDDMTETGIRIDAFRYAAFISYRHLPHDRSWAAWLLEQLERFRTPRSLTRRGIRRRIGRVYRDEDEVAASSDLNEEIQENLRNAESLIVVCSRDTPASKWIDREVAFFQQLGRADRIHVLLIEGEPATAFPRRLFAGGREPVAADVRPRQDRSQRRLKRTAAYRLIATLLGCTFDELRRREAERIRRRLAASALGILMLTATATWAGIDYQRRQESLRMTTEMLAIDRALSPDNPPERARRAFDVLPRRAGLFSAEIPETVRMAIAPLAHWGAVRAFRLRPAGVGEFQGPTRLVQSLGDTVLAGTVDGSLFRLHPGGSVERLFDTGCPGRASGDSFRQRCAITAAAEGPSGLLITGNLAGWLRISSPRRAPKWIGLSSQKIDHVVQEAARTFVISDSGGRLYRLTAQGATIATQPADGPVSAMFSTSDGMLVIRRRGSIQRWRRGSALEEIGRVGPEVLGATGSGGRLLALQLRQPSGDSPLPSLHVVPLQGGCCALPLEPHLESFYLEDRMEISSAAQGGPIIVASGLKILRIMAETRRVVVLNLAEDPNAWQQLDSPRYFSGLTGVSRSGRFFYSVVKHLVIVLDLQQLAYIDAALNRRDARARLCAIGLGRLFARPNQRFPCAE